MSYEAVESAAESASAAAESVCYLGRKVQRRRSENRRQAILEAALQIIVDEGVRAVRHRAVAAQAQVPLSATTYYFKTIDELISDTFALYAERNAEQLSDFWRNAPRRLQGVSEADRAHGQNLLEPLVSWLSKHLLNNLKKRRESLLVAQAFRDEALRNSALAALLEQQSRISCAGFSELFRELGCSSCEQAGQLLVSLLAQLEYQGLLLRDGLKAQSVKASIEHCLRLIFALPDSSARL